MGAMGAAAPRLVIGIFLLCLRLAGAELESVGISQLDEVLFTTDPFSNGGMYNYQWAGWRDNAKYFLGTVYDSEEGESMEGKQVAYDAMCLVALRFRDGYNNTAEYILRPRWIGQSLWQIVRTCSGMPRPLACSFVGQLSKFTGTGPSVAERLSVMSNGAVFDMTGIGMEGVRIGTEEGLYPDATGAVAIEGVAVLDQLFRSRANDSSYSNRWLGWFREDFLLEGLGGAGGPNVGKLPAYETTALYTIVLADEARYAEYVLNEGYAGLCLLEIVQKCMPDAWALRRNDDSRRWKTGHCEIGTLVTAKGLPEISDQLRLGVGDGEGAYRIQYRDWALFMPLKGNGNGDFAKSVWAFGSKGAANSGADIDVAIYGGPSMMCGTQLPEPEPTCWDAGDYVMTRPELWEIQTYACGMVSQPICADEGGFTSVLWDDAGSWMVAPDDLMDCMALPAFGNMSEVRKVPLFTADGMNPKFKNIWRGWYDRDVRSMRRLEATDESRSGLTPDYWDTCLEAVNFTDDGGHYAQFELTDGFHGMSLGNIVAYCLPRSGSERLNRDTPKWNNGHCMAGHLSGHYGVENVSKTLRLGVGDRAKQGEEGYPDLNDWALFMPVTGNAEHGYWETFGGGNFANGVWAFGSKGVTNSLYDGPVYIYGTAAARVLFRSFSGESTYNNMWPGWSSEGPSYAMGDMDDGKTEAYDTMKLGRIFLFDTAGCYAVYRLGALDAGKTLLEIVKGCFEGTSSCTVGTLERFGGLAMKSMSRGLRIRSGYTEGGPPDYAIFSPTYQMPAVGWTIGDESEALSFGDDAQTVYIAGGPYECKSDPMEMEEPPPEAEEEPPVGEEEPPVPR